MSPVPVPPGGVFWAPPSPLPLFPHGSGFPPGVHASPRGQVPPWVRTSRPASRLLPSFQLYFPGTGGQEPGLHALLPGGQGQAFRLPCFQVSGAGVRASALLPALLSGDRGPVSAVRGPGASRLSGGQAFRGPGFRSASMLSGGHASRCRGPGLPCFQASRCRGIRPASPPCFQGTMRPGFQEPCFHVFRRPGFLYAFRGPCGQAFRRLPGGRLPDFQASSMLSGGQGPDFPQASGSMLSGDRGPGPGLPALLFFLRSIFGLCLLY